MDRHFKKTDKRSVILKWWPEKEKMFSIANKWSPPFPQPSPSPKKKKLFTYTNANFKGFDMLFRPKTNSNHGVITEPKMER